MGSYPTKETKTIKAESFNQESLSDSSFSVLNIHSASGVWGGLLVVVVIMLAASGNGLAKYLLYVKKCRTRALTSLGAKLLTQA